MANADSCIGGRELAALVERRLGRSVFGALTQADVALEGRVERIDAESPPRFRATISIGGTDRSAAGTRELISEDGNCRALDEPLTLAIALMVDPDAALLPPSPSASQGTAAPVMPPIAPAPPPPPWVAIPEPAPEPSWGTYVMGAGAVAFGLLPAPSPGIVLRAGLAPPRAFPIEAHTALWSAERATAPYSPGDITFALIEAGLSLCPAVVSAGRLGVVACGGLEAGTLSSRGLGPSGIVERHRWVANGIAQGRLTLDIGKQVMASIGGGVTVPFVRDFFDDRAADGTTSAVFRLPVAAGVLEAGLGFRSP